MLTSLRGDSAQSFAQRLSMSMFGSTTMWLAKALLPVAMAGQMDPVAMSIAIERTGDEAADTTLEYFLNQFTPATQDMQDQLVEELGDLARRRAVITAADTISYGVRAGTVGAAEAELDLLAMVRRHQREYAPPIEVGAAQAIGEFLDWQEERRSLASSGRVLKTGWLNVDSRVNLVPSYGLIAARTSHGKTGVALQLCLNAAANGHQCVYFSLEQPKAQLVSRALCIITQRTIQEVVSPPNQMVVDDLRRGVQWLAASGLTIVDGKHTMPQIIAKCNRLADARAADLVVIDQMSRIDHQAGRNESTEHAWTRISNDIADLWKELRCPVILLAQLNVKDSREHPAPTMAQLKQCGSLAEDCCWCWILDRPEAEPERWRKMQEEARKAKAKGDEETAQRYQMEGRVAVTQTKDRNAFMGGNWSIRLEIDARTGTIGRWPPAGTVVEEAREEQDREEERI